MTAQGRGDQGRGGEVLRQDQVVFKSRVCDGTEMQATWLGLIIYFIYKEMDKLILV